MSTPAGDSVTVTVTVCISQYHEAETGSTYNNTVSREKASVAEAQSGVGRVGALADAATNRTNVWGQAVSAV